MDQFTQEASLPEGVDQAFLFGWTLERSSMATPKPAGPENLHMHAVHSGRATMGFGRD